ncbi:MAG: secreted protein [Microbacteriaceae bacterium]|nr:secreted protein [Microbacteriaceae bacterium]
MPVFAFTAAIAFILVSIFAPDQVPSASAAPTIAHFAPGELQSLTIADGFANQVSRDGYGVTKKPVAKATLGTGDAGAAQAIAYQMVTARGWGDEQFDCLVNLWNRESHWNIYAANASGAYGIPQALPGSKMASAGADWETNPATQIAWGLGYITGRYGTPCGAWDASETKGWY